MFIFHLWSLLIVGAVTVWIGRQGQKHGRFLYALYTLFGLHAVGASLALLLPTGAEPLFWLLQVVVLGVFLWGLKVEWQWLTAVLLTAILLLWLAPFPIFDILTWGLVTAVPFVVFNLSRQRPNVPIITPSALNPASKSIRVRGKLTPEVIESQLPLLECLNDGIIYSGQEGVVIYANQVATTLVGLSREQIVGFPITKVVTRLPVLNNNGRSTGPNRFEINGRIIQGHLNIVYNTNGVAQGTVAVLRDITAEHHAQRARDGFLTTISHELRTPITAIKGYVELLDSGAGGALTSNQKLFIKTIQRNINRLIQLINSLIFASAIKGGRLEFTPGYADLPQLIQQIMREMETKASQNNLHFQLEIEEQVRRVQVDPTHLATILEELISNGIKYNRPGGEIRITVGLTTDETNKQTFAVVSVGDTGIGIEPADQAHIFEEFFHPEQLAEQVQAGGIGMGLSIVRSLVEAYNGRIWFESTPGQGTTFTFIIPTELNPL